MSITHSNYIHIEREKRKSVFLCCVSAWQSRVCVLSFSKYLLCIFFVNTLLVALAVSYVIPVLFSFSIKKFICSEYEMKYYLKRNVLFHFSIQSTAQRVQFFFFNHFSNVPCMYFRHDDSNMMAVATPNYVFSICHLTQHRFHLLLIHRQQWIDNKLFAILSILF